MRGEGTSTRGEQPGFTLVEFAIALVIFGLLVGGILQGMELLNNSRIKQSAGEFQAISTAYASYQDRYQALPGDDGPLAAVQARGGEWASVTSAGDSSGELAVELEDAWNAQGEQAAFWQHLRAAGFVAGDPSLVGVKAQPPNAFGGRMGIITANSHFDLAGLKLCMSQIPGRAVSALDLQLDDGAPRTGDLRANEAVRGEHTKPDNNTPTAAYSETGIYTICKRI